MDAPPQSHLAGATRLNLELLAEAKFYLPGDTTA